MLAEGHSLIGDALAVSEEASDGYTSLECRRFLCFAKLHLGEYEQLRTLGESVLAHIRGTGMYQHVAHISALLGYEAVAANRYAQAEAYFEEGLEAARQVQALLYLADPALGRTYVARARGDRRVAHERFGEALQYCFRMRWLDRDANTASAGALLVADRGERELALELWALASSRPMVANSRWFDDVIGKEMDALAAEMPSEIVSAAEVRGHARDMKATLEELIAEWGE
jgi:tetratricopeptide (TPR) repeat protein